MTAKEQRTLLKEFRRRIALKNGIIPLASQQPCSEDCRGNCPACQAEVRYLDSELNRKAAAGEGITLFGVTLEGLEENNAAPVVAEVVTPVRTSASDDLLDMPLEELGLTLRTRVSLEGHGLTTLRQLLELSLSDCRSVRNMTQEGLDEIEYQLGLLSLSLKKEP